MKNDLQPGVNVEENPLAKALEIQQKRVLDVLEMAMVQAMNDIRAAFEDLSDADEIAFEAKLCTEVATTVLRRHVALVNKLLDLGDTRRAALAINEAADSLGDLVATSSPLKIIKLDKS